MDVLIVIILLCLAFIGIVLFLMIRRSNKVRIMREFRDRCEKAGITTMSDPEQKKKAIAIANSLNIPCNNIVTFFDEAMLIDISMMIKKKETYAKFYAECQQLGISDLDNQTDRELVQKIASKYFYSNVNAIVLYNSVRKQYAQPEYAQTLNTYHEKIEKQNNLEHTLFYYMCEATGLTEASILSSPDINTICDIIRFNTKDPLRSYQDSVKLLKNSPELIDLITKKEISEIEIRISSMGVNYIKTLHQNNIYDIDSRDNWKTALSISKKYGFDLSDEKDIDSRFVQFYQSAKEKYNRWCIFEQFSEYINSYISDMKDIKNDRNMTIPYRDFESAKQKRIYMLEREANPIKNKIKALEYVMGHQDQLMGYEKERDWASWGGAASALGGAGAGVMIAGDIQNQNQEIRERNQLRATLATYENMQFAAALEKLSEELQPIQTAINQAHEATEVLAEKEELFSLISITYSVTVLSTNIVQLDIKAKLKKAVKIADTFPAVIDGVLIAKVYHDNTPLEAFVVVLPYKGINTQTSSFTFKLPCFQASTESITVEFAPCYLSKIEQATGHHAPEYYEEVEEFELPKGIK